MKQNIAALELHYIIKELQFLVGGKLDNIYHPNKKELILVFHVPSTGKQVLRIVAGKVVYLTDYKPKSEGASSFCVYLRKKLLGARLRKLEQKGFERVVEFEFEKIDGKNSLFFELFGKGNIILVQEGKILSAVEQQKWADREVMPGSEYIYPQREVDFIDIKVDKFREVCKISSQESIVKTLALDLGLGKTYAEEACLRANIDKNSAPALGRKKLEDLFKELLNLKEGTGGYIYNSGIEISPIKLETYADTKVIEFETYNKALDNYFTNILKFEKAQVAEGVLNSEQTKINKIIDVQRKNLLRLESEEKENREKGELIYNKYQLVSEILLQIRNALKKYKSEEIKEKLKGHKLIKSFNGKDKTVVVEL